MTRRITRAKQTVRDSGARFSMPAGAAYRDRLGVVLHVLYLIFNEGYATTAGREPAAQRPDRGGDPADPDGAPEPAGRRRGHRPAGADAADRRPPAGPDRRARRPGADGRAGPQPVERRRTSARASTCSRPRWRTTTRGRTRSRRPSPPCTTRPRRRGHRLGADPRPLRGPAAGVGQPGRRAQPRRRGGHGRGPGGRPGPAGRGRRRPADRREPAVPRRSRPTCWRWPGTTRPPAPRTPRPPGGAPASRSSATCTAGPPGWRGMRRRLPGSPR